MPDFSSVSPKTWEEKVLDSIINGTDIGLDSQAKTLLEFQLERQAGITDIDTDFSNVSPRTAKEKLLDAIINGSSYTGSVKDFIERSLKAKLNVESIDPTQAKSYLEYLYAQGLASGEINSSLLKRYGFPYPNDYLFALFMDKETETRVFLPNQQILVDSSGKRNDAFRGATAGAGIIDDGTDKRWAQFGPNASVIQCASEGLRNPTNSFWGWIHIDAIVDSTFQYWLSVYDNASEKNWLFRATSGNAMQLAVYGAVNTVIATNPNNTYLNAGGKGFFGFEFINNTGGGNYRLRMYYKANATDEWSIVHEAISTSLTLATCTSVVPFRVGNGLTGSAFPLKGNVMSWQFGHGTWLSNPLVDADLTRDTSHGATSFTAASGQTFSVTNFDGTDSADGTLGANGLAFDSVDDIAKGATVSLGRKATVTALFRSPLSWGGSQARYLFGTDSTIALSASTQGAGILVWNTGRVSSYFKGQSFDAVLTGVGSIAVDTWYVVSAVIDYDNNIHKLYVNGAEEVSATVVATAGDIGANLPVIVGNATSITSRPFNGTVMHAAIMPQVLTGTEIEAQYQAIKAYLTAQGKTDILADLP